VTVAVSLADKLDTLAMFFAAEMTPTGSRDPFALRRAALGAIQLIHANELRFPLLRYAKAIVQFAVFKGEVDRDQVAGDDNDPIYRLDPVGKWSNYDIMIHAAKVEDAGGEWVELTLENASPDNLINAVRLSANPQTLLDFFADRLKVQQREAGVRHDLIDAVFALGGEDDLVRLLARVRALQAFVGTEDGANLLAGYKRAANILKKEGYQSGQDYILSYTPENQERALIEALDAAEPRARDSVAGEDFAAAMGALASLRGPIDAFFDHVTVNDADPAKRAFRLALLDRFRSAVHQVADFSRIEG